MLRFAPSPTGDMHIDNLRVAILNFIVAQQKQENFTIRIDDLDTQRNIEGKDTEIMQILEKFALTHASTFHQSEHLHMYQTLAIKLIEQGKAFVCSCTSKDLTNEKCSGLCIEAHKQELNKLKENNIPFVVRIQKPATTTTFHDLIQGEVSYCADDVDSFIILDVNGLPSPDFACACDDMISGVSTIVREDTHLPHTPKQEHIKAQLGYNIETSYAHLPAIVTHNSEKMCEDVDECSIKWMFQEGYIPDAIINYLLVLGNENLPTEIFTLPDTLKWFDITNISKLAAKSDINKLRLINRQHLERMDNRELSTLFGFADTDIGKLAKLYLEEASTTKEIDVKIKSIFSPKNYDCQWSEQMRIIEKHVQDAPMINDFIDFQSYIMKKSGLKDENFFKPFRLLLTGFEQGPELCDIYPLIKPYLLEVAS